MFTVTVAGTAVERGLGRRELGGGAAAGRFPAECYDAGPMRPEWHGRLDPVGWNRTRRYRTGSSAPTV